MAESLLERMLSSSHLSGASASYIEAMYEQYLENANSVPEEWRDYFSTLAVRASQGADIAHSTVIDHFERLGRNRFKAQVERESNEYITAHERKQIRVLELVNEYRSRGHRRAQIDPLGLLERSPCDELTLEWHQLSAADLDTEFSTGSSSFIERETAPLQEIIDALEETYCGSIGAEYTYISDEQQELYLRQRLETVRSHAVFDSTKRLEIFERLTAAEGLENYLQNRYPGTKRFGLEGGESLIPMLHETLQRLGHWDVKECVIGMAHRGRLNVLVNILGKRTADLFDEFDGTAPEDANSGDVKYHQGFSSNVMTTNGEMHVALAFNPSHLEIIGPVVEGSVRARQDRRNDPMGTVVAPILIHGDAAFAGQGVVMETFQMSQTRGYFTGGTIHIILNNQIGFTTSERVDARSTEYCSEVAKMVQAPILHVNGDDVEAVVFAAQIATDYRNAYGRDFVIDLVCYRRRGHNEAEDPLKTQPLMYEKIAQHPTTRAIYAEQLESNGVLAAAQADEMARALRDRLDRGETIALSLVSEPDEALFVNWRPYLGHDWDAPADTSFSRTRLRELGQVLASSPTGFVVHRQVAKILEDREKMLTGAAAINWGCAEVAAYATLLDEGINVRLAGQDVCIGTFSHRHAALYCQRTGEEHVALHDVAKDDSRFSLYNSLLSEEAALAFEYGYATTTPNALVIWEAQFGDFANGAQVVIDQFVSSGEAKWTRLCGLVMLLPHGYEGAGPEHSSARLERYLQLCAEHNMQVCVPTTPAQVFHLLRRQAIRMMRRPLIVMSPKSLLRHRLATSTLEELADGQWQNVIGECDDIDIANAERLVMCSGKVFYNLLETRRADGIEDTAILRIEQQYPFPKEELINQLNAFEKLKDIVWCQEEPKNQGAWYSLKHRFEEAVALTHPKLTLRYAGRDSYAAPASGSQVRHSVRQERAIHDALYGS
ncbi:MAG: 2-oxoglutarate dehydrogenase E1 component [Gammaproteobacteria bacterium]|nr:2-oxoglutarate dehydrogenase E1 component [Gammaproteobacteria bacterium]